MGTIILYLVSLGLFWLAALLLPFLFIPVLWMIDAVRQEPMSTSRIMNFIQIIITMLLLLFTQFIWDYLDYKTVWFPWFPLLVAVQNFFGQQKPKCKHSKQGQCCCNNYRLDNLLDTWCFGH